MQVYAILPGNIGGFLNISPKKFNF